MIRYHTTWCLLCQIVMCLIIFVISCKSPDGDPNDLSRYYLPAGSFPPGGMIYTYKNVVDSLADPEVWEHQMPSKAHILSINYDSRQQVVQKQYEQIMGNGVIIDSLILYFREGSGAETKVPVRVHSPNRYPFEAGDSSRVWLTKLEWWQPGDSLHVILERRRRFMGHTTWTSEEKQIPAIRFRIEDKFETEEVGWTTSKWSGEEIYAKDIGLVRYIRNISDKLRLEFELESRKSVSK